MKQSFIKDNDSGIKLLMQTRLRALYAFAGLMLLIKILAVRQGGPAIQTSSSVIGFDKTSLYA